MENIEAMLCAYIEGDLDAAGRAQIEKHLQEHPQHRKLIQELAAMRDLVRGLPRVKAPLDVGESLRGKVERSILLDDSPEAVRGHAGGNRWPQIFAIAAIFLLCASLCLVLYKALGPTLKPPAFTENLASKLSATATPPADALTPPSVPAEHETIAVAGAPMDDRKSALGLSDIQRSLPAFQQQMGTLNQLNNVEAIRRRLQDSGYDIEGAAANTTAPVLMVVSSTDPPATDAQVTQFLSNNGGISWKRVPVDSDTKSIPATLPSAGSGQQLSPVEAQQKAAEISASAVPTTQPASDVYIATGFTSQQADALRQSLAQQQNLAKVQVSVQSAAILATTRPSSPMNDKVQLDSAHFGLAASPPATEPSEAANSSVDLTAASTMPSNSSAGPLSPAVSAARNVSLGSNAAIAANNSTALSEASKSLHAVDAVIVVQSASLNAPAPGTSLAPATQPSPTTQP